MMTTIARMAAAVLAAGVLIAPNAYAAAGGEAGSVDTSALPEIEDGNWLDENPYRGSKKAMELGKAAYDGNCARCHGIDMISGGIAPDLRELGPEYDEYFINHVRNGVQRNGMTYMPAFEGVLDQQTMWAIRSYVDRRHYEYKDKNLDELYEQWDQGEPADEAAANPAPAAAATPAVARGNEAARARRVADDDMPDRLEQIRESGSIEVAVYDKFPPWSYKPDDGAFTGIDVEIGRALAERLDVGFNLRTFIADETMGDDIRNQVWKGHYMGGGTADAMLHVGMAPEFQQENDQASFIAAYYNETMGFAYDAERLGGDVDSPLALRGKPIGVGLDTLGDYFLTSAYRGQLRNDVVHFNSVPQAMQALNAGEVAAVMAPVGELAGAARMLQEKNVTLRTVELGGMYQTNWDVGVAIKASNPELAEAISEAMQQMRDDGTIEAIFENYGVEWRPPLKTDDVDSAEATHA